MLIADWIALGLIILFALLGLLIGFGKGLRFFTKGFFGFLISIAVCYCLGGLIIKIGVVNGWLESFRGLFKDKTEWYFQLLVAIRIDIIVYYVALFIIVQIVRIIIVAIVTRVFESKNVVINIINRLFGIVLFLAVLVVFVMIAFQIICIIGGDIEAKFLAMISEGEGHGASVLKLDWFYHNNPIIEIIEILFKFKFTIEIPVQVPGDVSALLG